MTWTRSVADRGVLGQDQARNWVEILFSATISELRAK
jgi:hypothetical protein